MTVEKMQDKIVKILYYVHLSYLVALPGLVNFFLMMEGGAQEVPWMNPVVFFLGNAFMMAVYLGVVTELKNFPDKLWKAIYFILSVPAVVLVFAYLGGGDMHDFFIMNYFGVVLGVAFFAMLKIFGIVMRGWKAFMVEFKNAGWPIIFFILLFVFCIWFLLNIVHATVDWWFMIVFLGAIIVNFYSFKNMLVSAEREQEDRAVVFILVGVLLWMAGLIAGGIMA